MISLVKFDKTNMIETGEYLTEYCISYYKKRNYIENDFYYVGYHLYLYKYDDVGIQNEEDFHNSEIEFKIEL